MTDARCGEFAILLPDGSKWPVELLFMLDIGPEIEMEYSSSTTPTEPEDVSAD